MNFENASKGIKLLFKGLMFNILSEILACVAVIIGATGHNYQTMTTASTGAAITVLVLTIAALVVAIVAFIQILRGLIWARKDESCFNYALGITIVTLVVGVIAGIFSSSASSSGISGPLLTSLGSLFECVTIVLICTGISNIYKEKGNLERAKEGLNASTIFVIVYALAKALEVLVITDYSLVWDSTLVVILSIIELVLVIVAFVKFVLYLNKARKEI